MFGAMLRYNIQAQIGKLRRPGLRTLFNSIKQKVNDENSPEVYPVYTFRSL
jgi:hypothetical protein